MRTILILTEEEARAVQSRRGRSKTIHEASMVLTENGTILKAKHGFAFFRVDMEKLDSVLNGEKRVTRKKG